VNRAAVGPLKIALVCDWYHPRIGGIELHLRDLALRLREAGHDARVITPTRGPDLVDGVRVHRVEAPLVPHFGFIWTPGALRSIGATLARERFDVAHCHVSIVSPAALGGAHEALARGIPTVLTCHSMVPGTRLLASVVSLGLRSSRWPAVFSAVSGRVAREVQSLAGKRPVTVLPNGVDVSYWRAHALTPRQSADSVELISVMRLNAKKRPLALVSMMSSLRSRLPRGVRASLCIVGDGPLRQRVARAIAWRGLQRSIQLAGTCSRSEIRELFARSDLFVLPSVRESFGLAALEARCAGLPIVAMSRSAVGELIAHGREGLLARSDRELAAHVATLVVDSDARDSIAAHNRDTQPPVDWATVVPATLAIYRDAIALRATD
jgi:glycosyltransferase involved in cell wall biosynthesis